jgi:hypothetical protein
MIYYWAGNLLSGPVTVLMKPEVKHVRGHNWTEVRLTDGWRLAFKGRMVHLRSSFFQTDDIRKVWNCSVCGSEIYAVDEEKLRDARRRMKVPFDCARALIKAVHEE